MSHGFSQHFPTVFLWFSQVLPRVFSHFPIFSHNFPTFPMILLWIPGIFLGFSLAFPTLHEALVELVELLSCQSLALNEARQLAAHALEGRVTWRGRREKGWYLWWWTGATLGITTYITTLIIGITIGITLKMTIGITIYLYHYIDQ